MAAFCVAAITSTLVLPSFHKRLSAEEDDAWEQPLPRLAVARFGTARFRGAGQLAGTSVSGNGDYLGTGNVAGTVRLWEVDSGRLIAQIDGRRPRSSILNGGSMPTFAFSHSGRLLAVLVADGILIVDTETGTPRDWRPKDPARLVGQSIHFTADDRFVVVRTSSGQQAFSLASGEAAAEPVKVDPKHVAPGIRASKAGRTVTLMKMGERILRITAERPVSSFAVSDDGSLLASGSREGGVTVWSVPAGKRLCELPPHGGDVSYLSLSKDGSLLAVAGKYGGNRVRLWKLTTDRDGALRAAEWLPDAGHRAGIHRLQFDHRGRLLSTGIDNTARLWSVKTQQQLLRVDKAYKASISSDGSLLVVLGLNSGPDVKLLDIGMSHVTRHVRTWQGLGDVALTRDGSWLAYLAAKKPVKVRVEEALSGTLVRQFDSGTYSAYTLKFSPDGKKLAFGGTGGRVKVWNLKGGKLLLDAATASVHTIAFTTDGRRLVTAPRRQSSDENGVQVWDLASGKLDGTFGRGVTLKRGVVMPDNRRLIGGCLDGRIRVWDLMTGRELATLSGHRRYVTAIALSLDGTQLASGAIDSEILLWDATRLPR